MRLAVFLSGGGSNFQAILDAHAARQLPLTPALCVASRAEAGGVARAQQHGVPVAVIPPGDFADETAFGEALLDVLAAHRIDVVALAGYLKKIPDSVVSAFSGRILNVHPSLLPAFGGQGMYGRRVHEAVLAAGVRWTGATVHLVDTSYDTGPIVLQAPVPVRDDDTPESLAARVLAVEHRLFPEALRLFATGDLMPKRPRGLVRSPLSDSIPDSSSALPMIAAKELPAPPEEVSVRRALLSVFDKTNLVPFARRLHALGIELVSTGGTARTLREAALPVTDVDALTGFPELLDGRVKTLHPAIHAGLLARRTDPADLAQLDAQGIAPIDLVVVNLYPFEQATAAPDVTDAVALENVDIGGPTMVRAAAKNFFFVGVVTAPDQYDAVAGELEAQAGALGLATRRHLAHAAFAHTAAYDQAVAAYFARATASPAGAASPEEGAQAPFCLTLPHVQALRYGENPHQAATLYGHPERFFTQRHGKELSYNNLLDLSAALALIDEFAEADPTVAILKHTNPCGVATAATLADAYARAFATDRQSPFGGIVVVNRGLDRDTAEAIDAVFTEVVIAPGFDEGVLAFLQQKANRRLIERRAPAREETLPDLRSVVGGLLVQARDPALPPEAALRARCRAVTRRAPTEAEWRDLDFAWRVVKHVKSNAIVYARDRATLGVGAGQMSRIDASQIAVGKGRHEGHDFAGAVVASDAFFPFADGLLAAAACGARAAIQPGGSIRDEEVIQAADAHDLAMVFTGTRHFRH